jgi:micrococcal nuclease
MKKILPLLGVVAVVVAAVQLPAQAQTAPAKVVSIGDGDTITVQVSGRNTTVRLACIDASEMGQSPFGKQSRDRLQSVLPIGQVVNLRKIDTDKYGRTVAEIYVGEQSVNLGLVNSGDAVVYRQFLSGCNSTKSQYLLAESNAKSKRLGFWNQDCATMPWDFRQGKTASCGNAKTVIPHKDGTCTSLKAQGIYGPFYRGTDPNYTLARDRDKDGIACE